MISDEQLREKEAEVEALFGGGSPWPMDHLEPNEERIQQIMGKVRADELVKDSVSFMFKSFGTTLGGLANVLLKAVPDSKEDDAEDDPDGPSAAT